MYEGYLWLNLPHDQHDILYFCFVKRRQLSICLVTIIKGTCLVNRLAHSMN